MPEQLIDWFLELLRDTDTMRHELEIMSGVGHAPWFDDVDRSIAFTREFLSG